MKNVRAQKFSAEAQETGDMLELTGLAGIGLAECQHLEGQHIDFEANKIWLYRHKTDSGFCIPIFPQLLPLLQSMKEQGKIKNGKKVFKIENP